MKAVGEAMVLERGRDQLVENFQIPAAKSFDKQPNRNSLLIFIGHGIRPVGGSGCLPQRVVAPNGKLLLKTGRLADAPDSARHSAAQPG